MLIILNLQKKPHNEKQQEKKPSKFAKQRLKYSDLAKIIILHLMGAFRCAGKIHKKVE